MVAIEDPVTQSLDGTVRAPMACAEDEIVEFEDVGNACLGSGVCTDLP